MKRGIIDFLLLSDRKIHRKKQRLNQNRHTTNIPENIRRGELHNGQRKETG